MYFGIFIREWKRDNSEILFSFMFWVFRDWKLLRSFGLAVHSLPCSKLMTWCLLFQCDARMSLLHVGSRFDILGIPKHTYTPKYTHTRTHTYLFSDYTFITLAFSCLFKILMSPKVCACCPIYLKWALYLVSESKGALYDHYDSVSSRLCHFALLPVAFGPNAWRSCLLTSRLD